jgi:cyclic pyranopterin phosphate synthase
MIASGQQQPISLRISVTDRCQLRCLYCMPSEGVPICDHRDILRFEQIVRFVRVVKSRFGLSKVHITGGEPLVRPGIVELVAMLAAEDLGDLAMTTNAQHLERLAGPLRKAGLHRLNVSLDTLNDRSFASLTGGGRVQPVMEGIQAALDEGLNPVKLNTVVLRGYNDREVVDLAVWAIDHGCPIRFLELMPIGCAKSVFENLFVPASEIRCGLEKSFALEPLDYHAGESTRYFLASDSSPRRGTIGFISPQTDPFCGGCRRLRLTSTGTVISCLARGHGPDIRAVLRDESQNAEEALGDILAAELDSKSVRCGFDTGRAMVTVGG